HATQLACLYPFVWKGGLKEGRCEANCTRKATYRQTFRSRVFVERLGWGRRPTVDSGVSLRNRCL
ncbi:unnamed protein product, partial [Ectocarpus sp. 12 AP-2014]